MYFPSGSSIRLQELGPRLTLELMKVERGVCEGEVLYHSYLTKTQDEVTFDALLLSRWGCYDFCHILLLVPLQPRSA